MRATTDCANAIAGEATLDVSGSRARGRAHVALIAARGSRLRIEIDAPIIGNVGTLTNDGVHFAFHDAREKRFVFGPSCAASSDLPVSPFILSELLRGQAPVLKSDATTAPSSIGWSERGYYVVRIPSTRNAIEELHLVPLPQDWAKPWNEQRLRVLDVRVWQEGILLYHAELDGHAARPMTKAATERPEDAAVSAVLGEVAEEPLGPNGPACNAELPTRVRLHVPPKNEDAVFRYERATWNPVLGKTTFQARPPSGIPVFERRGCSEEASQ